MPKLKTRQSINKRFKITKRRKVVKKHAGQDHFNAREGSKVTRHKRRPTTLAENKSEATIKRQLPYS